MGGNWLVGVHPLLSSNAVIVNGKVLFLDSVCGSFSYNLSAMHCESLVRKMMNEGMNKQTKDS